MARAAASAPRRPAPPRRTQAARSAGTQKKLLTAAAHVLISHGYAGATVQAICTRADVSQGGLFRHYATVEALMVAVADHVSAQLMSRYRREFLRLEASAGEPLLLALELMRKACRSRPNQAWYELLIAARTRPALRRALQPMLRRYHDDIESLARQLLPALAAQLGAQFRVLVDTMLCVFDGEAVHRFVTAAPATDAARLALLPALILGAAPHAGRPAPAPEQKRARAR